jgi:hypothetical protein
MYFPFLCDWWAVSELQGQDLVIRRHIALAIRNSNLKIVLGSEGITPWRQPKP